MTSHGYRASSNWRYRVMKRYKQRAEKFYQESQTVEERKAWAKIIRWFDTILLKRSLTPKGAIGLDFPRVCYHCANFDNITESPTHLKCDIYETYVHTPEKAQKCKHFLLTAIEPRYRLTHKVA